MLPLLAGGFKLHIRTLATTTSYLINLSPTKRIHTGCLCEFRINIPLGDQYKNTKHNPLTEIQVHLPRRHPATHPTTLRHASISKLQPG